MVFYVLGLLISSFSASLSWFESIFTATNSVSFYLVIVFIILIFRYLLAPILGQDQDKSRKVGDD